MKILSKEKMARLDGGGISKSNDPVQTLLCNLAGSGSLFGAILLSFAKAIYGHCACGIDSTPV